MNEEMIIVEHISKKYRLGVIGRTSLQDEIQRLSAKIHHKEDPTTKIGSKRTNQKGYFLALNDVSFSVKKGEAKGIIGGNGAGKSTLLKLITRVTGPTDGRIILHGKIASMLEVGTGFHPELTGRENIYLNGGILGMTKAEIAEKMEDIIEFSECREFIDTPVKRYSSGMYVKLAFSVAAHLNADIMIMDEVLAVGDVNFQNKCISKMKELASSGKTILYVSHNMATIRSLCDSCLVMEEGKLIYDGNVEEAIQRYIKTSYEMETSRRLDNLKRPYYTLEDIQMQHVSLPNKDSAVFEMGETMMFNIKWHADHAFEQLCMRIVVFRSDGEAAAVSFSQRFNCREDSENSTNVSLDISHMLPGKYFLEIVFMECAKDGKFIKHDVLKNVLFFEVILSGDKPVYTAYNATWGYVELPDAEIL